MKEKYIFFTLLVIALGLLIGGRMNKGERLKISAKEQALEKRLKQAAQRKLLLPQEIDINKVQDLVAFSHYEGMLKRSPFFKVQRKQAKASNLKAAVLSVEDSTPVFLYKGKILSGKGMVVIIEQTRTGETLMVAKGENIDGYKVLDITDTGVILSKKGEENIVLKTIEGF